MTTDTNPTNKYEVGQIWKYNTRSGEEGSRIYIVKTEVEDGYGIIYHIHVDGLKIKNPRMESGLQNDISHAPVDRQTLDKSVTTLMGTSDEMPSIQEGYQAWKEAFDQGEAGVFNVPVADLARLYEQAISK